MIIRQNHKWDKILWHIGLSWWQRQRYKLYFHFLPHRIVCFFKGHKWSEPSPIVDDGPLHLPPRERYWRLLALHRQCGRCAKIINIPFTDEDKNRYIEESIKESEEEWDDPDIRAALEALEIRKEESEGL